MNEMQFGNRIRQALNQGLGVNAKVAARLRAARMQALERQREPISAAAWADNVTGGGIADLSLRWVLPAAMLVAGVIGLYAWQDNQRAAEIEELDALLLTGDLPIDAYLDKGFEAWLAKHGGK